MWVSAAFGCLVVGILVATGYAMSSQRQLVDSYRDRALTAEREQVARVAQARAAERTRIAREMHDVLAHRISLVAMNAGTLSYRTDLSDEERAAAARSIEDNAQRALSDLRAVLGVLRDPTQPADGTPERPQPGIDDIAGAGGGRGGRRDARTPLEPGRGRDAGGHGSDGLPDRAGGAHQRAQARDRDGGDRRHRRHTGRRARRRRAQRGTGGPGGAGQRCPRPGLGLIGLAERAELAGGRISHGVDGTGGYTVRAWIPWTS